MINTRAPDGANKLQSKGNVGRNYLNRYSFNGWKKEASLKCLMLSRFHKLARFFPFFTRLDEKLNDFWFKCSIFPCCFFLHICLFWIYHETQLIVAMDTAIYKDQCNKVCKGNIIYSFKTSLNERCSKFGMKIYQIRGRLLLNLL